jgi:uridine kinase
LRIAGFPSCGKTTISRQISKRVPNTIIIESEAWIYSLRFRIERDLSGAHPGSYDLVKCCSDLENFFAGKEINLKHYDHEIGDHGGESVMRLSDNTGVVLDGTPFSLEMFEKFAKPCVVFYPKDYNRWLEMSVNRDVTTRFFSHSEATRHNMRKARDIEKLLRDCQGYTVVYCLLDQKEFLYEVPNL